MKNSITMDIAELEQYLNKVIAKLKEKKSNNTIEIIEDYYWNIGKDELYNINNNPKELTIGQISEDIEMLRKSEGREVIAFDFVKLSSIFRYIGESENW